jgi:cell division septum initiation protein DivIVA
MQSVSRKEVSMSTAGIGLLGSDADNELHPQFTRVLKGLDPDEVESYVSAVIRRVDGLERELKQVIEQRDLAQRRYASVREEAYRQAAARMGDVLRTADMQAERLRQESEEEAARRIAEATEEGERIRMDAQGEAHRLRQEGQSTLRLAQAEAERVLGGLAARREAMIAEMSVIRERMSGVLEQLENVIGASAQPLAITEAQQPARLPDVGELEQTTLIEQPDIELGGETDDLLGMDDGFDFVIPDILGSELDEP